MSNLSLAKIVKDWKKVKPLTLTKTGITEELEKLKSYERKEVSAADVSFWTAQFPNSIKFLKNKQGNKKIKKQKKVVQWLGDLSTKLEGELKAFDECHDIAESIRSLVGSIEQGINSSVMEEDAFGAEEQRDAQLVLENAGEVCRLFDELAGICPEYADFMIAQKSVHLKNIAQAWVKLVSAAGRIPEALEENNQMMEDGCPKYETLLEISDPSELKKYSDRWTAVMDKRQNILEAKEKIKVRTEPTRKEFVQTFKDWKAKMAGL